MTPKDLDPQEAITDAETVQGRVPRRLVGAAPPEQVEEIWDRARAEGFKNLPDCITTVMLTWARSEKVREVVRKELHLGVLSPERRSA
jgi:hypothetical protein